MERDRWREKRRKREDLEPSSVDSLSSDSMWGRKWLRSSEDKKWRAAIMSSRRTARLSGGRLCSSCIMCVGSDSYARNTSTKFLDTK